MLNSAQLNKRLNDWLIEWTNEWMNALFVLANIKYQVTVNPLTEAHSKIQWARVILTFGVSAKNELSAISARVSYSKFEIYTSFLDSVLNGMDRRTEGRQHCVMRPQIHDVSGAALRRYIYREGHVNGSVWNLGPGRPIQSSVTSSNGQFCIIPI